MSKDLTDPVMAGRKSRQSRTAGLLEKALDNLEKIRDCPGHRWGGPIQRCEDMHGDVFYIVRCERCPAYKAFDDEENLADATSRT